MQTFVRRTLFVLTVLTILFWVAPSRSQPRYATEPDSGLTVAPLSDQGGIERGLNLRLTAALEKFLREHRPQQSPLETVTTAPRYLLEGEVSFAAGQSEEQGRFLMILRLFRGKTDTKNISKRGRKLIGQWAGTAVSLRYLTANLRNDSRVHLYGLIGELGSRVLVALRADRHQLDIRWHGLFAGLPSFALPLLLETASETALQKEPRPLRQITAGVPFRVGLPLQESVQDFLLVFEGMGKPTLTPLVPQPKRGRSARILLSQPIRLPLGTAEVWLLQSRPAPDSGAKPILCTYQTQDSALSVAAPVTVLEGVGSVGDTLPVDIAQEKLYFTIVSNRERWRVARFRFAEK